MAETPIQESLQSREAIIGRLVEEKLFVMLKLFAGISKKQVSRNRTEKKPNSQDYRNFRRPPQNETFSWYKSSFHWNDGECSFRFAIALETL